MSEKPYSFIEGIDWDYVPSHSLTQSEISIYSKWLGLPIKQFTPVTLHLNLPKNHEEYGDTLSDFLKEKYPSVWEQLLLRAAGDYALRSYLAGYFKEEIDLWLKDKLTN
ncbi:hypothetical protein H6G54_22150 [Anabaena cylindrica FACHB-243]|uniref:hypothetical protein n=1 Tax=Anabaena TaxID=1163 RepID=UPI0005AA1E45|nr:MULTISPECIES: hypothetical protein [Anabaena]MBD2420355.1 hypothetical protein [Anabaena cylindrica FACHB-243]MBY5285732.1 hypothetical protein [Anabaena sp. CCAP 1446/1C]MBY5310515.1 hypothetical protein [Anabaena sp. CCAP 1446/1C]MCM2410224.1 hypothetical protein [Anabaena sp. CCAP 1446/1C]BAY05399.1 hypothetical protein NIES19_46720 [Anabaena cylindrica PCC 7122]